MPPTGFKRSRALWDHTRFGCDNSYSYWSSVARAILYELQPIRWSAVRGALQDWRQRHRATNETPTVTPNETAVTPNETPTAAPDQTLLRKCYFALKDAGRHWLYLSFVAHRAVSWLRRRTRREYGITALVVLYYFAVRWLHAVLEAGPMVIIVTLLVLIFTVGLGEKTDGGLSAYSVFNRGLERMLGTVDADELVAQHLGGGMMMMGHQHDDRDDEDVADDVEEEENNNQHDAVVNRNEAIGRPAVARRSGKKARRQRREERRQREVAGDNNDDDYNEDMFDNDFDEADPAMQRLIEEQIMREAAQQQG